MLPESTPDVFLDSDVVMDLLAKREPFVQDTLNIMQLARAQKIRITISESSLANLIYLSFEIYSLDHAAANLIDLLGGCELIHASSDVAIQALQSPFKDKEDA